MSKLLYISHYKYVLNVGNINIYTIETNVLSCIIILVSSEKELETVLLMSALMLPSPNCRFHPTVGIVTFIVTSSLLA